MKMKKELSTGRVIHLQSTHITIVAFSGVVGKFLLWERLHGDIVTYLFVIGGGGGGGGVLELWSFTSGLAEPRVKIHIQIIFEAMGRYMYCNTPRVVVQCV